MNQPTLKPKDINAILFESKSQHPKAPTWSGKLEFNKDFVIKKGQELEISLWGRTASSGKELLAGEVKRPYNYVEEPMPENESQVTTKEDDIVSDWDLDN